MFDSAPQMSGISPEGQAKQAIAHVLSRIRNDAHIGWYLGYGTQSFGLLTEAYATLTNTPIDAVRENYEPLNPKNPKEN